MTPNHSAEGRGLSPDIAAEEKFLESSRKALASQRKTSIMALDFHLWSLTSAERELVTLHGLRDGLSYLSPLLVSDDDITEAVTRSKQFRHTDTNQEQRP